MKIIVEFESSDDLASSAFRDAFFAILGSQPEKVYPVRAPPAPPDARPEHPEKPIVEKIQIAEKHEEVPETKRTRPRIPHELDELILQLREEGKLFREIHDILKTKGVVCELDDICARHASASKKQQAAANGKKPHNAPTPKEESRRKAQAKANEVKNSGREDNSTESAEKSTNRTPEPVGISRAELDERLWEEWKDGLTVQEISDRLCAEGLYFGPGTVRSRLRAQGADA